MSNPPYADVMEEQRQGGWVHHAKTLILRTAHEYFDDRLPGLAAEVAFFTSMALPPMLLALLGCIGYITEFAGPGALEGVQQQLLFWAGRVFNKQTLSDVVAPAIEQFCRQGRGDVASIGILLTFWSISRAVFILLETINIAYDVEHIQRTFRQKLIKSWLVTAATLVVFSVVLPMLVVGPNFGRTMALKIGLASAFERTWTLAYWPINLALGISFITTLYHISPQTKTPWVRDLPGAIFAVALWNLLSWLMRLYAQWSFSSNSAYAAFAVPMVLLLWIYVSAIAVLLGAELNAEIEKLWPSSTRYSHLPRQASFLLPPQSPFPHLVPRRQSVLQSRRLRWKSRARKSRITRISQAKTRKNREQESA
jgi:membrane protein